MTDSLPRAATPAQRRSDVWLAGALLVAAVLSGALGYVAGVYGDQAADTPWLPLYAVAITAPLALRRRFPVSVMVVVSLAFFGGVSLRVPEMYVGNIAVFIAIYTVGAWVTDRRRATVSRVLLITGMFVWLLVSIFQASVAGDDGLSRAGLFSPFAAYALIQMLVNAAYFGGAYYFGERAWAQALARSTLTARTGELERERERTAAQAVALDRVRIARELHDVVAHHVSAMGVQAGAARTMITRDPDAAAQALTGIEQSARDALSELRHLLETLRTPEAPTPNDSTVTVDGLAALAEHATQNGLPTRFTVVGSPAALSRMAQVNLYRIAQEALTNARRHAGPGASADVRLRYDGDEVELEITNTGRERIAARAGLGLLGMRERATASGGTLEAGPRVGRGGFLVRARLPREEPALTGATEGAS